MVQPLGKPLNLKASNYTKLEEAIMQVGFYTWGWSYNAAYLFKQDWFWNPIVSFLDNFPRQANEYAIFHLPKQDWRQSLAGTTRLTVPSVCQV
jgi:hypothetical protein